MNKKRCIYLGLLLWVLIFFEVSILMFGFGLKSPDTMYYAIHFILAGILVAFVSLMYFKGRRVKRNALEGVKLGVCFTIVSVVLDAIITIPLFVKDYGFFLDASLWLGYLEAIVISGIVGFARGKQAE